MAKVSIKIDGKEIHAEEGSNLLEVARQHDFTIPSLCHDPRLEPFGACRLCLVDIEGARGFVQSCGAKVRQGMVVRTNTENVVALRRLALELLLSEHCGDCLAPCQRACPAGIDIQGFVAHIANGQPAEAAKLIREKLPMPASVGRICPRFCEEECRRNLVDEPVSICALKRFAGDAALLQQMPFMATPKPDTGKMVAVVGGGPAGLAAAYYLAMEGHRVTIFDASPQLGGMMRYGIPEYRLPKEVLDQEIQLITGLCQNVFCNKALGKDFTLKQLKQLGFEAVFLGIGSWDSQRLRLPGEDLTGVYSGIQFLRQIAMKEETVIGSRVVVVGGGNTAMDAARTAVRMGAQEVTIVYRRSRNEMPASKHEIEQAEEEGIKLLLLTNPLAFLGVNGKAEGLRCVQMKLGEPDSSGRCRPVPVPGSEFEFPADAIIIATGQKLETSSLQGSQEVQLTARGVIQVDRSTLQGNTEWVFAGGDCVTGPATVVEAQAAGRQAAYSIHKYLTGEPILSEQKPFNLTRGSWKEIDVTEFATVEKSLRVLMPTVEAAERKHNFAEFEQGLSSDMAAKEAIRCLSCGCQDVFTCRLREYATQFNVDEQRLGRGKKHHAILDDHPYIISDPNKCILCGNCVRICQGVVGIGALGFVNRGSKTVILPALELPLAETTCTSCGQCADVCPTGALIIRNHQLTKSGPWHAEKVGTTCSYCSIGCQVDLEVVGNRITGIKSRGNLCGKCISGYESLQERERLAEPLVKKGDHLEKVAWEDAFGTAWSMFQEIRNLASSDSLALVLSPNLTNEEYYLANKLGRLGLGTTNIFSTKPFARLVIPDETKDHCLQPSFEDLQASDLILVIDGELTNRYPVAGSMIRKAVAQGSKLLMINSHVSSLDSLAWGTLKINKQKLGRLLESFVSYIIQYNLIDKKAKRQQSELIEQIVNRTAEDFYDIAQSFWLKPDKIIRFIHQFIRAKNPVIVVDGATVSGKEMEWLRDFALLTANLDVEGRGVLPLYPYRNVQGLINLGVAGDKDPHELLMKGLEEEKYKGLLIVSNDLDLDPNLFGEKIKKVLITPYIFNDFGADIILPSSNFAESSGTVINTEGRVLKVVSALPSPAGKETWEILLKLLQKAENSIEYSKVSDIFSGIIAQQL